METQLRLLLSDQVLHHLCQVQSFKLSLVKRVYNLTFISLRSATMLNVRRIKDDMCLIIRNPVFKNLDQVCTATEECYIEA